ncbi:MAG: tetratricopeptide repeat protein [Bryobacteraceae bacterium]
MDTARWEQVQALFHEAADKPTAERHSFLKTACGGDEQLAAEVIALLEQDDRGSSLLDRGAAQVAGEVLGGSGPAAPPAHEFGPYRLKNVLGEGGMGVVWLAEREDLGSVVAIKILRDAWMSPARRERFAAEQRTLAKLTHPSIARLYDADTTPDGTPWFAMEYIEGVPLTEYCARKNSSIEERLRLFRSVCDAVRYAHSRAVIHRDLKPSNILVQSGGAMKLLDFGIAKQLDQTDENLTRTALRLMTPAYAAPEQLRGEPAGVFTDVYALGVVLFELLAGRFPERGASLDGPQLAGSSRTSRADLDVLCRTAMQEDPERRYASAEALLRDIDHFLAGQPLEARPDSAGYRLGKFLRRNRRSVAAASVLIAAFAGLVIFYTVRLAAARNDALGEAARAQRVLDFTLNLFTGGDSEAGPARDLRVTTLLDRGVSEARGLDREPRIQAEIYETLGQVYQKLGVLDRADELLQSALERRRSLNDGVADGLVKVGLLRVDQAKLEEAERLVRQGLEMSRRSLPTGHPAIAAATHALGKVLEERGSYDQAIQVLNEAVRLRSQPDGDERELAASLLALSNSHFYAGQYDQSEALNHRLLGMHRRLYGEKHPLVAADLINLGAVQQQRGNFANAESFHRQALEITRAFFGEDHHRTASNLTLIARAILYQKRHDEAVELLQRAVAIQERVFGKVHPRVASAVNEMGNVAYMRTRYDEAEASFRRVVDIYRRVYGAKHYLIGVGQANVASALMARKENARAESLFREALAMYAQTLAPDHVNVGITRIKLGRSLLRQGRHTEAGTESLAGYRILSRQTSPSVSWLQSAREDLTAIYTALGQPEKAREFAAAGE